MARLFLLLALLIFLSTLASAGQPTITITYSPRLDWACSVFRGPTIKEEWKTELVTRQPEFEELWASIGPKMIAATESITGNSFPADEISARLILCNLPSQSILGLSVNMRYALRSFTSHPVPMRYKVDTLFHELLHNYLDEYPVRNSKLTQQHASEPDRVQNHLHLLALEKAVFIKLGELQALKDVITIDSQLPNGYYKRAWEIINATDDEYLKYVAEISR